MALAGSLTGLLVAWLMGGAEPSIRAGAFGFNSVLVAIALGSTFRAPGRMNLRYALFATTVTPFVVAAIDTALDPVGMPVLTLPFVVVTWAFLPIGRLIPALQEKGAVGNTWPQPPDMRPACSRTVSG